MNGNDLSANYDPQGIISFCPGGSQVLSLNQVLSSNPDGFLWSNGATSSQIFVNQTGAYSVTMTNSLTGCEVKVLEPAYVAVDNVPFPIINGELRYCVGDRVELSGNQGPSYTYLWTATKDGSNFTGFTNPTSSTFLIQSALAGNYVVTLNLTSNSNSCSRTNSVSFSVNPNPPNPIISSNASPACEGEMVVLTATNAGTNFVNWSNGSNGPVLQVYNSGIYRATFTDVNGCNSYEDYLVHPDPDFSFILSGCFDFCKEDEITIPGDRFHSYQYWEWQVTSNGSTNTYGGTNGIVTPLVLGGMDVGYYTVQLYAITDEGCYATSDPIYLSIKSCACEFFNNEPEIKVECMFEAANALIYYHVTIMLPQNLIDHCSATDIALVISSPDGTFTTTVDFPTNPMEGIFVPYLPGTKAACFEFNLENSNPDYKDCNCLYTLCQPLPASENCVWPGECDMNAKFDYVKCTGNTEDEYEFSLTITTNADLTVWFSVPTGTLTGMPTTLSNGTNVILGRFYFVPPPHELCININAYDSASGKFCFLQVCYQEDRLYGCTPSRLAKPTSNLIKKDNTIISTALGLAPNPASNTVGVSYNLVTLSGEALSNGRKRS